MRFMLIYSPQLHNLLELIKKEQDVCNVAMNEVIRQVSVDCVERGALLAKIREQYANLLAKVPAQIRGYVRRVRQRFSFTRPHSLSLPCVCVFNGLKFAEGTRLVFVSRVSHIV